MLAALAVGTPLRAFRRTEYSLYQENGRWWLGRRVASAATYDVLAGPLRPPPESGPAFSTGRGLGSLGGSGWGGAGQQRLRACQRLWEHVHEE